MESQVKWHVVETHKTGHRCPAAGLCLWKISVGRGDWEQFWTKWDHKAQGGMHVDCIIAGKISCRKLEWWLEKSDLCPKASSQFLLIHSTVIIEPGVTNVIANKKKVIIVTGCILLSHVSMSRHGYHVAIFALIIKYRACVVVVRGDCSIPFIFSVFDYLNIKIFQIT